MFKIRNRKAVFRMLKFLGIFLLGFSVCLLYLRTMDNCKQTKSKLLSSDLPITKPTDFLIVIIFSAPENFVRRQVIRRTWLRTKNILNIRHFFVIGSASLSSKEKNSLQNESSQFEDLMLLEKMSDSFSKLSNKLLEAFRWLDSQADFVFLLKVDDDSFVRLDALYSKMLKQNREKLYWGFFDGRAYVKRKGKWTEKNWFLCDRYLPYALGGGYILTRDLVKLVVLISDGLVLYQNEDVALGTWLSPFHIERLHDPLFDTEFSSRGCNNSYLVTHKQSTAMMSSKHNNILKSGKMCLTEYKSRNSYIYKWNVLPSLCCNRNDSSVP